MKIIPAQLYYFPKMERLIVLDIIMRVREINEAEECERLEKRYSYLASIVEKPNFNHDKDILDDYNATFDKMCFLWHKLQEDRR